MVVSCIYTSKRDSYKICVNKMRSRFKTKHYLEVIEVYSCISTPSMASEDTY